MPGTKRETRIFLLRHAETASPDVFHGAESDVELGERGFLQADAVAAFLASKKITRIVSSGMKRALQTAHSISQACNLPIEVVPRFHERKVGPLSGTPNRVHDGLWAQTLRHWLNGNTGFSPENSESFDCIQKRILPAWEAMVEQHQGEVLAVVAHGLVIKVLLLSILPGWGVSQWEKFGPVPNVGVTELVFRGDVWNALRVNEIPEMTYSGVRLNGQ